MKRALFRKDALLLTPNRWIALILLVVAIVMFLLPSSIYKNPSIYEKNLKKLDEKKATVTAVSAITAAAATALAAVPDDSTTPVADQIAELAGYGFLISLIILIEKYIITLSGFLSFKVLLPAAFTIFTGYLCWKRERLKRIALSVIALSLCLLIIVPLSITIDDFIDLTFDTSEPIRAILNEEITKEEIINEETKDGKTIFEKAGDFFSNLFKGAKQLAKDAVNLLNKFIDVFVALVLKDCIMPIVTFLLLFKVCKHLVFSILPNHWKNEDRKKIMELEERKAA